MRTIKVDTVKGNKVAAHNQKSLHIGEYVKFVFTDTKQELNTVVSKWGGVYTCVDCALRSKNNARMCVLAREALGYRVLCSQRSGDIVFLPLDTLMESL